MHAARILFWLALALAGAGAELLVLGEPAQDFHVHAGRVLAEDLQAPGRDLRDTTRGAVQQTSLGQVGHRPGDAVVEQRLRSAGQQDRPVLCSDVHRGSQAITQACSGVGLTVFVHCQARPH
jgi:hypothetical protein